MMLEEMHVKSCQKTKVDLGADIDIAELRNKHLYAV